MLSLTLNRPAASNQLFANTLKAASQKTLQAETTPAPAPTPTLVRAWQWLQAKFQAHTAPKPLELTGTLALGEKRTIFVVQVSGRKFLVGGTPNNLTMLADLGPVDGSATATTIPTLPLGLPEVKKERRRRSAPALLPESASHKATLPLAAKTVSTPRRTRKKAAPAIKAQQEEIAIW